MTTRSLIAAMAWFASIAVAPTSYGAPSPASVSASDFTQDCASQIHAAHRRDSAHHVVFVQQKTIKLSQAYKILVFAASTGSGADHLITAILQRHQDKDAEIPIFSAICIDNVAAPNPVSGNIEFTSHPGDQIQITFDRDVTSTKKFRHTKWTTGPKGPPDGDPSIWMASVTSAAPNPVLSSTTWPSCMGAKQVDVGGTSDQDLSFKLCTNSGGADIYEYSLHLKQTSSTGVSVDVVIDPLIINHN